MKRKFIIHETRTGRGSKKRLVWGYRKDYNFKDLQIGKDYKIIIKGDERGTVKALKMKLVDINPFYISFLHKNGYRECFPNHINLTRLEEV